MMDAAPPSSTAIIGIACRLPGADDPAGFWRNLAAGRDAIVELPDARWSTADYYAPERGVPGRARSRWCGLVDGVELFDDRLFQISPREARSMDPQQRLLLEQAWRCIEDAGLSPATLAAARTGVFVGVMADDYQQRMIEAGVEADAFAALGNYECILANRLSHVLGLAGPSLSVNAACASSLVALHLARRALAAGDCDYALVGAANLNLHPWKYVSFSQAGMLSPRGRCRSFDRDADGYVPGDGVALVLLTSRARALAEHHRIHALVRGSAINHVGGGRSITAPSVASQRELITAAAADAGVGLDTISYVEAHGTGTSLGDPIELAALERAFAAAGARPGACALGSVKSNIGHLEAAAGLAGLIKVVLMMRHQSIPRSLHLDRPNPLLEFEGSRFELATRAREWTPSEGSPRRAGVSSFGFGGANAHVIVEEAESSDMPLGAAGRRPGAAEEAELFCVSGHTKRALDGNLAAWRRFLTGPEGRGAALRDLCAVAARRPAFAHRFAACVRSHGQLAEALAEAAADPQLGRRGRGSSSRWALRVGELDGGIALAAIERLGELGFTPELIVFEGGGARPALVAAGVLEELDDPGIRLARPRVPVLDPLSGALLRPLRARPSYLEWLRAAEPLPAALIERGRALWQRQFTFTKYLREWERALAGVGVELERALAGGSTSGSVAALALAVAAALRQVDERWALERGDHLDERASELIDLVLDGALNRARACELVSGAAIDRAAMLAELDEGLARVDRRRPYRGLRGCNRELDEIERPQAWLAAVERAPAVAAPVGYRTLRLGGSALAGADELVLDQFDEPAWRALAARLWTTGVELERERFYPAGSFRVVDTPGYWFDRRRAWIEGEAQEPAPTQSRPASLLAMAREHRILARALVPGACLIAAALGELGVGAGLGELALLRPLELGERSDAEPELSVEREGEVLSLSHAGERLVRARVRPSERIGERPPLGWAAGGLPEGSGEPAYAELAAVGYDYGPRLRVLAGSRRAPEGWVFALSEASRGSLAAAIEAAFQALILAGREPGELLVPFALARLRLDEVGLSRADRVVVEAASLGREGPGLRGRAWIADAEGRPLLELEGVDLRRLEGPARARWEGSGEPRELAPSELLHRPVWRLADAAPEQLRELGPTWIVAPPSEAAELLVELAPKARRIDPGQLAELDDARRLLGVGLPGRILILSGFEGDPEAPPTPSMALVNLCRALARAGLTRSLTLVIATRSLHAIEAGELPGRPDHAALIGAAKSAARELEGLDALAVDLERDPSSAQLRRLLGERGPAPLAELAYRGERRYALGLEPLEPLEPPEQASPGIELREAGVYVIVGGLGGIGRALARWLARARRARIALIGRRSLDADGRALLAELEVLGGEAIYLRADTCERAQLGAALDEVRARFGRIDGAVHAALVLSDRSIRHLSAAHFEPVYAVKAAGARLLAELTAGDELDFLALFSSVLALQGNAGQANYVAGCAYQDALAPWLRARADRPALTIDWGHWGEVGAVADEHHAGLLREQGIEALSVEEGIAGFVAALAGGHERIVVARLCPTRRASMRVSWGRAGPGDRATQASCEAGLDALDRYARARVHACLREAVGSSWRPGAIVEREQLHAALELIPAYERLLAAWLADLSAHGLLEPLEPLTPDGSDRWRIAVGPVETLAELRERVLAGAPDKRAHLELLDATLDRAPALLSGRVQAPTVIFPGSSMGLVEGIYRDNQFSDAHNQLLAEAVVEGVAARPDRRVSILELGAGTGGSTARILPALDPLAERVRYVYSDVSRAFTKHGKRRFAAGRPYLEFALLDIEAIDEAAVERLGRFDLIVATNVVHACADLRRTLAGIRRLLAPGGRLVLNELCRVELFWTSTFGFLSGWWLFSDPELRLDHGPLVGPEAWPALLRACGFEAASAWGLPGRELTELRQCLVGARRPASSSTLRPPSMTMSIDRLRTTLSELTAAVLEVELDELEPEDNFSELGVDSILGVELVAKINARFATELEPTVVYDHPTIAALAAQLADQLADQSPATREAPRAEAPKAEPLSLAVPPAPEPAAAPAPEPAAAPAAEPAAPPPPKVAAPEAAAPAREPDDDAIAVIGIAGRFPGAANLEQFWTKLAAGVDSVTEVPRDRWDVEAVLADDPRRPNTTNCRHGGFLDGIDRFDPLFFKIAPREAERMDPQQRLFLQASWHALEDGGYAGVRREQARLGVFVGARQGDYLLELYRRGLDIDASTFTGTDVSMLAGRVAYHLDATGPAVAVDTACSSSLVAIHEACEHLRRGGIELALAGGVFVMTTPQFHIMAAKTGMLAKGGRCRAFDEGAEGFVPAEGVGVLLLKRAAAALADGDQIYGIIRASGVNQDGRTNGITAPSAQSQARLIREVHERGGVDPRTISYVEAHGTGTKLGDPIEVEGLRVAFEAGARGPLAPASCALGSVKTNIGHAATAAGVAGVLKVLLALRERQLPPSLHFERENQHLKLDRTPFRVITRLEPWAPAGSGSGSGSGSRRAGVSSFGFSGTNCHLVLEEAPADASARSELGSRRPELFVLSAQTDEALGRRIVELGEWLRARIEAASEPTAADLAYSLAAGRSHERRRVAFVAADLRELAAALGSARIDEGDRSGPSSALLRRFVARLVDELAQLEDGFDEDQTQARRELLEALADGYREGHAIDWLRLYPRGRHRVIPLPTYPFAEERHWPEPPAAPVSNPLLRRAEPALPEPALPEGARMLVQSWRPVSTPADAPIPVGRALILIGPGGEALGEALRRTLADARVIRPEQVAGRASAEALLAEGPVDMLVDLSELACGDRAPALARVGLIQGLLAEQRHRPMALLHVGDRLAAFEGAGRFDAEAALVAELFARLGAEHRQVAACSLDLDLGEFAGGDDRAARVILAELGRLRGGDPNVPPEPELTLRRGQRYAPILEPRPIPAPASITAEGVYLITGGVRGLGLELARRLVERGARKLVLLGRRPIPDPASWPSLLGDPGTPAALRERVAPLQALVEAGVELRVHAGELGELDAIAALLRSVRRELGPIRGFIHCAGVAKLERPAFLSKSAGDLAAVFGPKLAGLRIVDELLADDPLELVVGFSSVSTLAPRLAPGLLDYAGANAVLNRWARHRRAAGRPGQALAWGNWTGAGMGPAAGRVYAELGLETHDVATGLELFERALAVPEPVVMPLIVDPARFELERLASRPPSSAGVPVPSATPARAEPAPFEAGALRARFVEELRGILGRALKLPAARIELELDFAELGVDSILIVELVAALEDWLGERLDPALPIDHPKLGALADRLLADHRERIAARLGEAAPNVPPPAPETIPEAAPETEAEAARIELVAERRRPSPSSSGGPIAVIGMACKLPGAPDLDAYWSQLRGGRDCTREIPPSRWSIAEHYSPRLEPGKSICKRGGFIEGIEQFDPGYFGIPEDDAAEVDPLVRQFLEVGATCVHHAGYRREELAGRAVGVFVGARVSNYAERLRRPGRRSLLGVGQNFIAAHLAHFYDLRGPALVVDTACSSSLVSLHQAAASLRAGDCELALAGGVEILLDEVVYQRLSEARVLSPEGRCRVFDERAAGFVPGEGAGAVLLTPLERALDRGDRIYAVLEGSAVNNDGRTMGVTTPNPEAQQRVVREALRRAGLDARQIGYVEAHGTGTALGDPIELRALSELFGADGVTPGTCPVGSVKSNLGHLLSAAGIASVLKVALALGQRELPPTLHCDRPNPRFDFASSPFWPCTELRPWAGPLRAGISSFGFGGTNVHAILAAAPEHEARRRPLDPPRFDRRRYWLGRAPSPESGPSPEPASEPAAERPRPLGRLDFA